MRTEVVAEVTPSGFLGSRDNRPDANKKSLHKKSGSKKQERKKVLTDHLSELPRGLHNVATCGSNSQDEIPSTITVLGVSIEDWIFIGEIPQERCQDSLSGFRLCQILRSGKP